jgi:hypothetical protein
MHTNYMGVTSFLRDSQLEPNSVVSDQVLMTSHITPQRNAWHVYIESVYSRK